MVKPDLVSVPQFWNRIAKQATGAELAEAFLQRANLLMKTSSDDP